MRRAEWFWGFTLLLVLVAFFLAVDYLDWWQGLGVPHLEPLFADIQAVLAASDCHRLGHDVFIANPCDKWERVHVYGSLFLYASSLGLTLSDAFWVGWVLMLAFWVASLSVVRPSNLLQASVLMVYLVSPAMLLGVERANNDLLIFVLLVLGVWMAAVPKSSLGSLGAAVVVLLASMLKLFPAAAIGAMLLARWHHRPERFTWVLACAIFLLWLIFQLDEIRTIADVAPKPSGAYTFGAQLLWINGLSMDLSITTLLLGAFGVLFLTFSAIFLLWRHPLDLSLVSDFRKTSYLVGLAVLLFCFVANSNYDYRNIFFLLMLPVLFELARSQTNTIWKLIAWFALGLYALTLWAEVFPPSNWRALLEQLLTWLALLPLISIGLSLLGVNRHTFKNRY